MFQVFVDTPEVYAGGAVVDDVEAGLPKELLVVEKGLVHFIVVWMGEGADSGRMVVLGVAVGKDRVGHFNISSMFVQLVALLHFILHLFIIVLFIIYLSAIVASFV